MTICYIGVTPIEFISYKAFLFENWHLKLLMAASLHLYKLYAESASKKVGSNNNITMRKCNEWMKTFLSRLNLTCEKKAIILSPHKI